ncbi:MAG: aminoglycoside phosphotransferase [Chloroflexi bacterium OLB15]|nr:MAG: aminoglycoside phosphotransferase [Chloroflexi bacterium OLB15]
MINIAEALPLLIHFLNKTTGSIVVFENAVPLAGGASREMVLLTLTIDGVTAKYVLRRDPPTQMNEQSLTRAQEFEVMSAAYDAGVRVAKPRWLCEDPAVLGSPFFIMDYVEGMGIGRKVVAAPELAEARAALPRQMAEELAKIHALSIEDFDFLPAPRPGHSSARDAIAMCYEVLDTLQVFNPAIEAALRWAERNAPAVETWSFVHGDFRIGNLLVNETGLAAVADWEFCHVGDPDEDIGYPCMRDWRFGMGHLRFAGVSDRETFLQAYEAASGRKVNRDSVDFWEILGNIRWGVICLAQANRHLSGRESSVELASIGRRSAEMQLETLRLIQQFGG